MNNPLIAEFLFFFFQAEDGIRVLTVTGVQTCALPISSIAAARSPTPEKSSGPAWGSSLGRYWSSSSSRSGSLVSNPSLVPSSGGGCSTRNAAATAGLGGSSSTSGWNGGRGTRAPAACTLPVTETITPPAAECRARFHAALL